MKTLSIIGCGLVGETLGRMWTQSKIFRVESILNRSIESGRRAVEFVGSGRAAARMVDLADSDLFLIATPDDTIEECCRRLCDSGRIRRGAIVFHCSGFLPSHVLNPASERGAFVASVHPVKSFADPEVAAETFRGTSCAIEGDESACLVLGDAFEMCGAQTFRIETDSKEIYHAGTVFACNYLVALMEVAYQCFEKAGLDRKSGSIILNPIIQETVRNIFSRGTAQSLTGPVSRGDRELVERQSRALQEWSCEVGALYHALGRIAVDLSLQQGKVPSERLEEIMDFFENKNNQ